MKPFEKPAWAYRARLELPRSRPSRSQVAALAPQLAPFKHESGPRWTNPPERAVMLTESGRTGGTGVSVALRPNKTIGNMRFYRVRPITAVLCAVALALSAMTAAFAQSGDPKAAEQQQKQPAGDTAKEGQKKIDEIAEAGRLLTGPAANPECVWLGRRVVNLLWRDDLDTAFRHLDLYDRFGCPGGHIQATFRCLVRQGHIDPKAPESLNGRVHACWLNPDLPPSPPAAQAVPAAPNVTTTR